jgi:hypothetical protein
MRWLCLLSFVSFRAISGGILGEENSIFRVLPTSLTKETDLLSILFSCSSASVEFPAVTVIQESYLYLLSHLNRTLPEIALTALRSQRYYLLSHHFNSCRTTASDPKKEILLHVSLALWPWNSFSCKNLGFYYERFGSYSLTKDLYRQHYHLQQNHGIFLQDLFTLPFFLKDDEFLSLRCYLEILLRSYFFLRPQKTPPPAGLLQTAPLPSPLSSSDDNTSAALSLHPMLEIREFQLDIQYLGFSPGVVMEIYSLCLWKLFSSHFTAPQSSLSPLLFPLTPSTGHTFPVLEGVMTGSPGDIASLSSRTTLRLGIVSENQPNSSPGLCLLVQISSPDTSLTCLTLR